MVNVIPAPLRRLLRAIGVDRTVGYGLIGQGASIALYPIILLLITHQLTPEEQGYYVVFGNLLGLQMFLDLGFGVATLHYTSHEAGLLTWTDDGRLVGDPAAKSRLASVLRLAVIWYLAVAVFLACTVGPWGYVYFLRRDTGGVAWQAGWVWAVLQTGAALAVAPLVQFLAACGKTAPAARAQAGQSIVAGVALCLALAAGGKLLSWPMAQTLGLSLVVFWLVRFWRPTFADVLRQTDRGPKVSWWREVWPFQWKVAVSALAFYLMTQTFSLALFDKTDAGKAEAGRMGISVMIMGVLTSITLMWIGARVPVMGHLVARRDWDGLDGLFRRLFVQAGLVAVAAALAVWAAFLALRAAGYELGNRVLAPLPLALLLGNVAVQTMIHAFNAYLRAHKREPLLWLNVAVGATMLVAVLTVGQWYGSAGMAASLLVVNATIGLGGGSLVFARCRRTWHAPEPVPA